MYSSNILSFKNIFVHIFIILNNNRLSVSGNSRGLRIFHGRDAERGEFPYVVSIAKKHPDNGTYKHHCTGSIITPTWVLTAAHCIPTAQTFVLPPSNTSNNSEILVILYVSPTDNYTWTASYILRTIPYLSYRGKEPYYVANDIALAQVQNVKITASAKVSPIHFGAMYGHKVFSLGLGLMKSEDGRIDMVLALKKSLQVLDAVIIKCGKRFAPVFSPSFCLAWNCRKPAVNCPGDSGGPIVHPTGIVGVISGGERRQYSNTTENIVLASIVTPVSPYVDWIASTIRGV